MPSLLAEMVWPGGTVLAVLAAALLLAGLAGWVLGRTGRPRAAATEPAAGAADDARQQAASAETTEALCASLPAVLAALSEAASQAQDSAGQAATQTAAMQQVLTQASDAAQTAAEHLAGVAMQGASLAQSIDGVAAALANVAAALADTEAASGQALPDGSLVVLAAQAASRAAALRDVLHENAATIAELAGQIEIAQVAAGSGTDAAVGLASASGAVERAATAIGLELVGYLDALSRAGDRRQHDRYATDIAASLVVRGRARAARVIDISRGGCAIAGDVALPEGGIATLHLPGVNGGLEVRIARRLGSVTGIAFVADDPLAGVLETLIVAPRDAA
jgi:predicted phage tail protein